MKREPTPFISGARQDPNIKHEVLLVTDGSSNDPERTLSAAKALQQSGVTVFALGIGDARKIVFSFKGPVLQIILENHNIVQIC